MDRAECPHLSRIVSNDELWEAVQDFDRILAESLGRLPETDNGHPTIRIGRELHGLAFDHFHLTLVFRYKSKEIARGIFSSFEMENPVVLFNLARAFVEHTSSIAYQENALKKAVSDISGKQIEDQIHKSIEFHRDVARRLYYGGEGSPVAMKRIHVNDLLKSLGIIYQSVLEDYERLCEFVHPNYGSNTLVSSGDLASGKIGISADLLDPELRFACDVIERCAEIDSQLIFSSTRALAQIGDWVWICSQTGAKVSQIFSLRSAYSGDGSTKNAAIFFAKARTHLEAVKAFYAYIEKEGIILRSRQVAVSAQPGARTDWPDSVNLTA